MKKPGSKWRRAGRGLLVLGLLVVCGVLVRGWFAFRDRIPGYELAIQITPARAVAETRPLRVGFARVNITPDVSNPAKPVWLAGFSQNRSATGVHDDLWAVGVVLDDGWTRVGIVSLDAIGFFQDDVVRVRQRLGAEAKIDFAIVTATHNHSTPDLMGLWGPSIFKTGVDPAYREQVIVACARVLQEAARGLRPALVNVQELALPTEGLVSDTRKPEVFDPDLRVMHFIDAEARTTLGSLVTWGNHPETVWSGNREITSDFCGYLRDALERGISVDGQRVMEGLGGIHVYANGALGGLMSTTPSTVVRDPFRDVEHREPSHEKARAVGLTLAKRLLPALQAGTNQFEAHLPLGVYARTIRLKLENQGYLLAGFLGLIDRGYVGWKTLRSEVALLTLGNHSLACVPGEIYPEIVNGGVEQPAGADYTIEPLEVPPLRQVMPGGVKFVLGLANDEIGYLLPKSQWDRKAPYTYGAAKAPYGEINSVGPDAAATVHGALKALCEQAQDREPRAPAASASR